MKKQDFVRNILAEEDAELIALISQKFRELPLVNFLTFLLSQKDKLNAPSQQALRSKYDQIGEQAIACSPVAQQRYRSIDALLNLVNNAEVDQTLQANPLASDPLFLEMLAFYAEKYLQDASTHDLALRTIEISVRAATLCGNPLTLSISLYQKGLVLFKLNQMKAAIDCFQTSLEGFQHYYPRGTHTLHIYLALCHDSLGQAEEARHHFYALVRDENSPGREIAYRRLGEIEFQLGNLEKAKECLQKAESYLTSKPKDLAYLQVLQAQVERRLGNLDAAEVIASKAVDSFKARKDSEGLARAINVQFLLRCSQGRQDEGEALLCQAYTHSQGLGTETEVQVLINQGKQALAQGHLDAAESYWKQALDLATRLNDDLDRARSLGNLGALFLLEPKENPAPYLMQALRLFEQLHQSIERAEVLYNVAKREIFLGLAWKLEGLPNEVLSPLHQAEKYLKEGIHFFIQAGNTEQVIDGYHDLSFVYETLGWEEETLQSYLDAAEAIEQMRLGFIEDVAGATYVDPFSVIYEKAIQLAWRLNRPKLALALCERFKARHLLKNLGHTSVAIRTQVPSSASISIEQEVALLEQIRNLYANLQTTRQLPAILSLKEQIIQREAALRELYRYLKKFRDLGEYLAIRQGQPVRFHELLGLLTSLQAEVRRCIADNRETIEALKERFRCDTGSIIACPVCHIDNFIGSTYCSICEARLPRSVSINLDVLIDPESLSEAEKRQVLAEGLYNDALKTFDKKDFVGARELFQQAIQLQDHPDYRFFMGWCDLALEEPEKALLEFEAVFTLQDCYRYPFYPLPISPNDFREALEMLRQDLSVKGGFQTLYFLATQFAEHYRDVQK